MKTNNPGNHNFALVPSIQGVSRSLFDRSHRNLTNFNAGFLIPYLVQEIYPGDSISLKTQIFARFATLQAPIMDNVYIDTHVFFVPNRLVWEHWENFQGEKTGPSDSTVYTIPQINDEYPGSTFNGILEYSLGDYMGLPTKKTHISVNALPVRAYALIHDEWFRDQNTTAQLAFATYKGDAVQHWNEISVLPRMKRHDYFTSCLPSPQKGAAVSLPLGTVAPISGIGVTPAATPTGGPVTFKDSIGISQSYPNYFASTSATFNMRSLSTGAGALPNVFADLSQATAATINDLRQAFQVQKILERDARGGTRYTEILRSHWGVISPDARLQRPEYLGGVYGLPLKTAAIAQNSQTDTTAQGTLAAIGYFDSSAGRISKSFVEHGYLIGLISARADLNYQQGLNRMWSRQSRFDFYMPELAHLGEQPVRNREIFFQGDNVAADAQVFGYQEAWADLRYNPSIITGGMRSNATGSFDIWHLAQDFSVLPTLETTFMTENPPISRVVAVDLATSPAIIADIFSDYKVARKMPVYSVPGLIDHF